MSPNNLNWCSVFLEIPPYQVNNKSKLYHEKNENKLQHNFVQKEKSSSANSSSTAKAKMIIEKKTISDDIT